MNSVAFLVIAIITLSGALAAAALPKLIHAALSLVIVFVGVAAYFFLLGAEFVGLVQVFVYIGAVAVLIVFTILLTRRELTGDRGINWGGAIVALAVFGGLLWTILKTKSLAIRAPLELYTQTAPPCHTMYPPTKFCREIGVWSCGLVEPLPSPPAGGW